MRSALRAVLSAVSLAVLASCAPREPGVALDTRTTPASLLVARVSAKRAALRTVAGEGTASFDSPEMNGSASFALALIRPDSMLVQLRGPFGISVGFLFLSRERFLLYNSIENSVSSGAYTDDAVRSVIPARLTFDELLSAFTGMFPLPQALEPVSYATEDGQFVLHYRQQNTNSTYWVDPEDLLVRHFQVTDTAGTIVMEGFAKGTISDGDIAIPRRIALRMPEEEREISIAFSSADLNSVVPSFTYSIPRNARWVRH